MRLATSVAVSVGLALGCATPPLHEPRPLAASESPVPAHATAPPRPARDPLLDAALARASAIRGLPARRAVPGVRVDRKRLLALVREHVAREIPPAAIRAEGLVQKLLGLFPTGEDYEETTYALLERQLAGYYEPADGTMYLANDLDEENATETLSHEIVHALQDQYWDLGKKSAFVAGEDDRESAVSALAEGEATSVTLDLAAAAQHPGATALDTPDAELVARLREGMDSGASAGAPPSLQRALVAPYIDGVLFVHALRRSGGWASVDDAWSHPPETTEEVLHPEKWRAHEPALVLPDPPPPRASPGLAPIEANTYGEQGLRLTFDDWMSASDAAQAASGWGGDRLALYGRDDQEAALLWHIRFDEAPPDAPAAFSERAFAAVVVAIPRLGRVARRSPGRLCVERAHNGVMAVVRDGRDLFLAVGTTAIRPGGWAAVMGCAAAETWVDDARRTATAP